jgi:hypothetical protein
MYLTPKVMQFCPVCSAHVSGGYADPGQPMKPGMRTFYKCGASVSCEILTDNVFRLLIDQELLVQGESTCRERW